jgi:hypothetical protein
MITSLPSKIDPTRCHAYAQAWIAAWNSHQLERIMSHYATVLSFSSPLVLARYPGSDGTIRDAATLREYFALGLGSAPTLRFQLLEVLRAVEGFSIYYVNARGGHTAEYVELDADDRATRVICAYSD